MPTFEGLRVMLSELKAGDRCRVVSIEGGRHFRKKLVSLGITPGISIEILQKQNRGPALLRADNTRIMLGVGMQKRIEVSLL